MASSSNVNAQKPKNSLDFKTFAEVSNAIQNERNVLFLLGFGVTYIQPTRKTLEALCEFGKSPDYKSKVKVFVLDEEAHVSVVAIICFFKTTITQILIHHQTIYFFLKSKAKIL